MHKSKLIIITIKHIPIRWFIEISSVLPITPCTSDVFLRWKSYFKPGVSRVTFAHVARRWKGCLLFSRNINIAEKPAGTLTCRRSVSLKCAMCSVGVKDASTHTSTLVQPIFSYNYKFHLESETPDFRLIYTHLIDC